MARLRRAVRAASDGGSPHCHVAFAGVLIVQRAVVSSRAEGVISS